MRMSRRTFHLVFPVLLLEEEEEITIRSTPKTFYNNHGCVTKILSDLRWEPFEVRLCMLYRIQHSLMDIPIERYLQVGDSRTRGPAKFFQERITDTTYSNHLSKNSARLEQTFLWLSLPGDYRVTDEALLAETT